MKTRKTWRSKLTKKELEHLREVWTPETRMTLTALGKMFVAQKRLREKNSSLEPCWECRKTAKKLGFEV